MPARKKSSAPKDTTAHLGSEAKLWLAADTAAGACAAKRCEATWQGPSAANGKPGSVYTYGQKKRWSSTRFGRAKQAQRVRLRLKQPNQSNSTTRHLPIMNLALRGMAGFVLANGSMSSNQSGEGVIRATFQHRFSQASYASVAA